MLIQLTCYGYGLETRFLVNSRPENIFSVGTLSSECLHAQCQSHTSSHRNNKAGLTVSYTCKK